jgi:hypothetical protein
LTVIAFMALGALGVVLMLYVSCPLLPTPPKKALGEGSTFAEGVEALGLTLDLVWLWPWPWRSCMLSKCTDRMAPNPNIPKANR